MIDEPTLFILGAGASVPYGYPTGLELRAEIINYYSKQLEDALRNDPIYTNPKIKRKKEKAVAFTEVFRDSSIYSIDKFLALKSTLADEGKLAITLNMLVHEKKSQFREGSIPKEKPSQDWYMLLFNRMISTFKDRDDFQNFKNNKIAFITFNYDRSLEFFLYDSFMNTFSDAKDEIDRIINNNGFNDLFPFPLIHVYGQVASSGWASGRTYGMNYSFDNMLTLREGIRVIGERANGSAEQITRLFRDFKRVFFLGFSFADENLDALGIPHNLNADHWIRGTAYGLENNEINEIIDKMTLKSTPNALRPMLDKLNSYQLLRKYL